MKETEAYGWEKFEYDCKKITRKLEDTKLKYHFIYGVPRGGLVLAVRLSHLLQIPLTFDPYTADIIVDEICDTGKTFRRLKATPCVYGERIFVCIHKKENTFVPDISVRETDKWIVYPWENK